MMISNIENEELNQPTEEEKSTLRHVSAPIPSTILLLCFVEFAERASYYGTTQTFNNFLQFPLPEGGNGAGAPPIHAPKPLSEQPAGALNRGMHFANAFTLLFQLLAFTLPLFGAWMGDIKVGRYPTIVLGVLICGVAHVVQLLCALPSVLQRGHSTAPFILSLFLLAVGTGILKPNIFPAILDEFQQPTSRITTLKSGERVIVDPHVTLNRITLIFYCFTNLGAMVGIPNSYAERLVGFWLAFLLPGVIYLLLPIFLVSTRRYMGRPVSSDKILFFRILAVALKRNRGVFWKAGFWDATRNSPDHKNAFEWSDGHVDDVRQVLRIVRIFLWFPVLYLNLGGIGVVATSQASSLTKGITPNDLLGSINPLTIAAFTLVLSYVIYPILERLKSMPSYATRITTGFVIASGSSLYGAFLQQRIYDTSPCGRYAASCKTGLGVSNLSVWQQFPIFFLAGISECFDQVTAYEIIYTYSPSGMRAIVTSFFLSMHGISSAIGLLASPLIKDPNLVLVWVSAGAPLLFVSILFNWWSRRASLLNSAR